MNRITTSKTNKIGDIIFRLRKKFKHDGISSVLRGKHFYDMYIDKFMIIGALANPANEQDNCYMFSYEIQYDFRNFTDDDYLYIKTQLTADLSATLHVYVNCNVDSFSRIIEEKEIHYVKIQTFIRKPPKEE